MKHQPSDLIAIANAELAERLQSQAEKDQPKEHSKTAENRRFKQDIWRAVYTLNLMRYLLAFSLLMISVLPMINPKWQLIERLIYPDLFQFSIVLMLLSAIAFTYLSKKRDLGFNWLMLAQLTVDLILAGLLTHSCGSITSNFALLFFLIVATGSVVLPRMHALGLASAGTILLFYEHIYSVFSGTVPIQPNYEIMVRYGIVLLASALIISYLAERIRIAEMQSFVPGDESIEDFLVREEINALKGALERTDGNKTEAAKLLGMTFRSFRYKLTKYDIS